MFVCTNTLAMHYWLVKSEPDSYSWEQFLKDKKTSWDGVRNYAARNNLRAMAKGDLAFYYHSNNGLEIVGVAQVSKTHYPDPTSEEDAWVSVELKPKKTLKKPVSLASIKATPSLADLQLVKLSRLSVSAVTASEFAEILRMAETTL